MQWKDRPRLVHCFIARPWLQPGVFLAFKMSGITSMGPATLTLGALTVIFATIAAIAESDIKKLIAFSTCANLGLMAIGISNKLTINHLIAHAPFKATLFMLSGIIIHTYLSQDLRKIGGAGLGKKLPLEKTMLVACGMANLGVLYTIGNFSKEEILFKGLGNSTYYVTGAMLIILIVSLTTIYVMKLIVISQGVEKSKAEITFNTNAELRGTKAGLVLLTIASITGGRWMIGAVDTVNLTSSNNYSGVIAIIAVILGLVISWNKLGMLISVKKWYDSWTASVAGMGKSAIKDINNYIEKGLFEEPVGGTVKRVLLKNMWYSSLGLREITIILLAAFLACWAVLLT